jgi:PKD repeat protein
MNVKIILLCLVFLLVCWHGSLVPEKSGGLLWGQEAYPGLSITAEPISGTAPLTVDFTAAVTDPYGGQFPITFDWYFDDGGASTRQNPQHTYTAGGTYTALCRATVWKSPKVVVQGSIEIDVIEALDVSIAAAPNAGLAPLPVSFTSAVTGGIGSITYGWDFDDESTSTQANPDHAFTDPGTYIVTCTVTDSDSPPRTDQATIQINVFEGLNVSIAADVDSGVASLTVNFTSTVTGGVGSINYQWDFDDESASSNEANLSHTFTDPGTYAVTCTVTDSAGPPATDQATIQIDVFEALAVSVAADVNAGAAPLTVNFTSTVTGGLGTTTHLWDFDDESTSTQADPGHTFTDPGTYAVTCTVTDSASPPHTVHATVDINAIESHWPVAVSTATGTQYSVQIAPDGSGGALMTWQDSRGSHTDIYVQRVGASGNPLWTADGAPVCTADNTQQLPQLIADGSGGALIVWEDRRGGEHSDIYAQRLDASGNLLWTANGVAVCGAANEQYYPQLIADGSGGGIITWQDYRSGSCDIYAQRLGTSGQPLWSANGVAVCTAADGQYKPQLIADGAGGAIVTWYDNRSENYDIYAQRVDGDGNVKWTGNGVAICTAASHQYYPQICSDGSGGGIITWYDYRSGNYDIYVRRVDGSGSPLWAANGVAVCTAANQQQFPQITASSSGSAIITWCDARSGSWDIYAQRVTQDGTLQ